MGLLIDVVLRVALDAFALHADDRLKLRTRPQSNVSRLPHHTQTRASADSQLLLLTSMGLLRSPPLSESVQRRDRVSLIDA